jgi:hypothetical protein
MLLKKSLGRISLDQEKKTTRLEAVYAIADDYLGILDPSVEPSKIHK